jgi:peptidoglycan-associated lipoprotein
MLSPASEDEDFIVRPLDPRYADELEWAAWLEDGASVRFATGSSDLDDAAMAALERKAAWLARHPELSVLVEGHADARGSRSSNEALSRRRALAVMEFLKSAGVPPSRLFHRGLGTRHPECMERNELCWARNRKAALLLVGRGE